MSAPIVCRRCKRTTDHSNPLARPCVCSPRDLVHYSTSFVPFVVACGYDGDETGARTSSAQLEAVDCTPCLRITWAQKEGRELAEHVQNLGLWDGRREVSKCDQPWLDERVDEIVAKINEAKNEAELRAVDQAEIAGHRMSFPAGVVLQQALMERAKVVCPHIFPAK